MNLIRKFIIPLSILLLTAVAYFHPTQELARDLGEHLLRGQIMVQNHTILTTNLFSYTNANYPFVSFEWLSEIIFYILNSFFGIGGLIAFTSIVVTIAFAVIFIFTLKKTNPLLASLSGLLYLRILFERTYVRPEIFSYLFVAIFVVLLYQFREKFSKKIFLLLPLQLLWVNMHIYFIAGIFLIFAFFTEAVVKQRNRYNGLYVKSLLVVFVSSIIVSMINPYGFNGLLFPLTLSQHYAFAVTENANILQIINMHPGTIEYSVLFFQVVAIVLMCSLLCTVYKSRLVDWIISIFFICFAISAIRNFPLFVFATFIPFVDSLNMLQKNITTKFSPHIIKKYKYTYPLFAFILLFLVVWHIYFVGSIQGVGVGTDKYGESAVNFLITNNVHGPLYNNYDFGSFLAYKLYPKEQVFVDGRPEAYPVSFFQNIYYPIQSDPALFAQAEKKYQFNVIVYSLTDGTPRTQLFFKNIITNPEWKLVYLDDNAVIFLKNIKKNTLLIQKFSLSSETYRIPETGTTTTLDNLGYFLSEIGWTKQSAEVYKKIYQIDSTNCAALHNIIFLLGPANPDAMGYAIQYNSHCQNQ